MAYVTVNYDVPTLNIGAVEITTNAGNPNTVVTAAEGSLCLDTSTPAVYQNTDGSKAWSIVGQAEPEYDTVLSATITGTGTALFTQDNWTPGTLGQNTLILLTTNNNGFGINITGLAGGSAGKLVTIVQVARQGVTEPTFVNSGSSSLTANRFLNRGANDFGFLVQGAITYWYDGTTFQWRELSSAG